MNNYDILITQQIAISFAMQRINVHIILIGICSTHIMARQDTKQNYQREDGTRRYRKHHQIRLMWMGHGFCMDEDKRVKQVMSWNSGREKEERKTVEQLAGNHQR